MLGELIAKETTEQPMVLRTSWNTKNDPAPNISSTETVISWQRQVSHHLRKTIVLEKLLKTWNHHRTDNLEQQSLIRKLSCLVLPWFRLVWSGHGYQDKITTHYFWVWTIPFVSCMLGWWPSIKGSDGLSRPVSQRASVSLGCPGF